MNTDQTLEIDGEALEVDSVIDYGDGAFAGVGIGQRDFYLFADNAAAGRAAREYWADLAANDPVEFRCMVGDETLIAWCLGQSAGPGTTKVDSLEKWLDLHLSVPEEQFASYDGEECEVSAVSADLVEELGFTPTVAYRAN